jgi:hypothetical protein
MSCWRPETPIADDSRCPHPRVAPLSHHPRCASRESRRSSLKLRQPHCQSRGIVTAALDARADAAHVRARAYRSALFLDLMRGFAAARTNRRSGHGTCACALAPFLQKRSPPAGMESNPSTRGLMARRLGDRGDRRRRGAPRRPHRVRRGQQLWDHPQLRGTRASVP